MVYINKIKKKEIKKKEKEINWIKKKEFVNSKNPKILFLLKTQESIVFFVKNSIIYFSPKNWAV